MTWCPWKTGLNTGKHSASLNDTFLASCLLTFDVYKALLFRARGKKCHYVLWRMTLSSASITEAHFQGSRFHQHVSGFCKQSMGALSLSTDRLHSHFRLWFSGCASKLPKALLPLQKKDILILLKRQLLAKDREVQWALIERYWGHPSSILGKAANCHVGISYGCLFETQWFYFWYSFQLMAWESSLRYLGSCTHAGDLKEAR